MTDTNTPGWLTAYLKNKEHPKMTTQPTEPTPTGPWYCQTCRSQIAGGPETGWTHQGPGGPDLDANHQPTMTTSPYKPATITLETTVPVFITVNLETRTVEKVTVYDEGISEDWNPFASANGGYRQATRQEYTEAVAIADNAGLDADWPEWTFS